jgi:bisphosphoglycerate-dependent phosphoglycerate mutase
MHHFIHRLFTLDIFQWNKRGRIMIYVIRHGQTDLNKERKMQGRKGLPLNEYGIEQLRF